MRTSAVDVAAGGAVLKRRGTVARGGTHRFGRVGVGDGIGGRAQGAMALSFPGEIAALTESAGHLVCPPQMAYNSYRQQDEAHGES